MKIQEIVKSTSQKIQNVINGAASQYFTFEHPETEEKWTIRVSNHRANPNRADLNTLSFVLPNNEDGECVIRKKSFSSIPNQFFLDENGEFNDNFRNLEECIEYVIF
jgi:hypothetical protein